MSDITKEELIKLIVETEKNLNESERTILRLFSSELELKITDIMKEEKTSKAIAAHFLEVMAIQYESFITGYILGNSSKIHEHIKKDYIKNTVIINPPTVN